MRIPMLSYGIGIFGIFVIIISTIQWFFRFYDLSSLLFGLGIGVLFLWIGYVYAFMKNTEESLKHQKERTDAIVMWWTKQEKDEVKNKAKGKK